MEDKTGKSTSGRMSRIRAKDAEIRKRIAREAREQRTWKRITSGMIPVHMPPVRVPSEREQPSYRKPRRVVYDDVSYDARVLACMAESPRGLGGYVL